VPRRDRGALARLVTLAAFALALFCGSAAAWANEKIVSSRVWPAQEYTRVTLESPRAIKHQFFFLDDPERLVVDLEGVDLGDELKALPARVGAADPYIQAVRVGINRPNVVRIVFDLKTEVKPSVFPVAPVGEYKHRLVLDIYPRHPVDPLAALLAPQTDPVAEMARAPLVAAEAPKAEPPPLPVVKLEPKAAEKPKAAERRAPPKMERLVIVAVDAGHGGEDSGARGRKGTREKTSRWRSRGA
jgi:N-acetylmuramoyl-L-alanine amidase